MGNSLLEQHVILDLAEKMQSPDWVKSKVIDATNQNPDPLMEVSIWNDLAMAGGFTGVLPLYVELDRLYPDDGWDLVAHHYILAIKSSIENDGIANISMFGGLAGICYYIHEASRGGKRYRKILDKLNGKLVDCLKSEYLLPFEKKLDASQPIHPRFYETIQGLSGIGIYFLKTQSLLHSDDLLSKILSLFSRLAVKLQIQGETVPGWYISSEHLFLPEEREAYPNGSFNLGLSHGITGVLAFLSIASINHAVEPGQREAIEMIGNWLRRKRKSFDGRWYWDTTISLEEEVHERGSVQMKSRDAWCYGTPGVARSLYLAGMALEDQSLQDFALESFTSIFASNREQWDLPGPTFCHGISGLLMITHLMARDSKSTFLHEQVKKLQETLLSYYDPSYLFGFQNYEPMKNGKMARVNRADLLEGTSGVLLTLLSLNSERYYWHHPFLIDY